MIKFNFTHNIQDDTYRVFNSTCSSSWHITLEKALAEFRSMYKLPEYNVVELNAMDFL